MEFKIVSDVGLLQPVTLSLVFDLVDSRAIPVKHLLFFYNQAKSNEIIANDIYTFGMLKLICFPLKNTLVFTMHCHTLSAYYIYSKDRHSKQKEGRKEKEKERKWKQEERKKRKKNS